jgi:RimJ/RimL family protein N-acetyltransferase
VVAVESGRAGRPGLARLERGDGRRLRRFFYRLSPETIYRRFHSPITRPEQAHPQFLLNVDHHDREAVVAVVDGEIVGVARYVRAAGANAAEVAVVVADAWQRQGIATRMVTALAGFAQAAGVERFTMTMQADNQPVLRLMGRLYPSAPITQSQGISEAVVQVAPVARWA